jgi:hypothetical protein
MPGDFVKKSIP